MSSTSDSEVSSTSQLACGVDVGMSQLVGELGSADVALHLLLTEIFKRERRKACTMQNQ